ncbi:MAG TPA: Crp/Fnr family transcriptional regulator [Myxococcota bacterium]|nr:Crp/Fnr family transcriptional regulator [Myxococcota bacterium]
MDAKATARSDAAGETTGVHLRRAYAVSVRAGEPVFEIGEPGDALFVVQAGEVVLLQPGTGSEPRLVARLGPGDPVGETDALIGRARTVRAVAVSDARLLKLDRATLLEMCLERPQITLRILERLAQRTADLERRLAVLGMNDLVRPLARTLVRRAQPAAQGARASVTLRSLADASGLSLREAHRGLQELFERRLVRLVDDALLVPDPAALSACLEDDAEDTGSGAMR